MDLATLSSVLMPELAHLETLGSVVAAKVEFVVVSLESLGSAAEVEEKEKPLQGFDTFCLK